MTGRDADLAGVTVGYAPFLTFPHGGKGAFLSPSQGEIERGIRA